MWLVLGQHSDTEAQWVADGLRERSDRPVRLLTDAMLVHDCRWALRLGARDAAARLELGDGTVLDPTTVEGIVNRLCWLGAEAFAGASTRDREYATAELYALGLAWLESLGGRVVNRPAGTGLAGPWRRTAEWRHLARTVRLPIIAYDTDDTDDSEALGRPAGGVPVLVVDGQVVQPTTPAGDDQLPPRLPPPVRDGLVALQQASGLDLIEVELAESADGEGLALRSVPFLPAVSRFGDAGLDALHEALIARRGAGR
jgi:hypothetical protein